MGSCGRTSSRSRRARSALSATTGSFVRQQRNDVATRRVRLGRRRRRWLDLWQLDLWQLDRWQLDRWQLDLLRRLALGRLARLTAVAVATGAAAGSGWALRLG